MSRTRDKDKYVAVINQDKVTDEVRDIAVKYDPLNRSNREGGFHVTEDGELHIDQEYVMEEHKLIEKKLPNDAVQILRLPAERGTLVHQYGENGFRLYNMPAPAQGNVVGVLGKNGTGKSTALQILAGLTKPNLGNVSSNIDWEEIITAFRGTGIQTVFEALKEDELVAAYKPQHVENIPAQYSGTVNNLLHAGSENIAEQLDLDAVMDRDIQDLSGGELQRVAIAATLQKDADLYLIDEPSSYLDVAHRLNVARLLRETAEDALVLVVEHDLATLDLLADTVHVFYGEPGGFGVVSHPLSVKQGVNQFLQGRLTQENVQIRDTAITFAAASETKGGTDELFTYPEMEKSFDPFTLTVEPGTLYHGEVVGVLGPNGIGKTTFAKLLAGKYEPDTGELNVPVDIAYKAQQLSPEKNMRVRDLLRQAADLQSTGFQTYLRDPFHLEPLYNQKLGDLSGGELQRVSVAYTLARDADLYLLDEPSAYLDVEMRLALAENIHDFADRTGNTVLVIDHDLLLVNYVADRSIVFTGESGVHGTAQQPTSVHNGLNRFLEHLDITFRRDPDTGRPRANKPGSQKDREQKENGNYYA